MSFQFKREAEEGEENEEIDDHFKTGKRKRKIEESGDDLVLPVARVLAQLEMAAEEDAELNRQEKPAISKLKMLSYLNDVLSKKHLQQQFLDHGVLTLLRNWLEPLPDGSLPNIDVRAAVLNILNEFPIDLEHDGREQLKKSGIGKVVKFFSMSDEETRANKKVAKELVDKWSRVIFKKSTRFEDMKKVKEKRVYRMPPAKKVMSKAAGMSSRCDSSQGQKSGQSSSWQRASRPEAVSLNFVVRPPSKVDPDEVRKRAKQMGQDQRRAKLNKKLQQMRAPKRKQLQATKISVEGRGMVKYV